MSILDDADDVTPSLPTTVWVNVADGAPHAAGFSTFRLTIQV